MKILLPYSIVALWKFASTDASRPNINHVLIDITEDGYFNGVATDGAVMAIQEVQVTANHGHVKTLLIPSDTLKHVESISNKGKLSVQLDTDTDTITVNQSMAVKFDRGQGSIVFPDYTSVLPHVIVPIEEEPRIEAPRYIGLDAELLGLFGKHLKEVFGHGGVAMQIPKDNLSPVRLTSPTGEGFVGVIMPMRIKTPISAFSKEVAA